jgi:maleate isomerase
VSDPAGARDRPTGDRTRVGVIFTPDNANDHECWRWCPPDATLLFTRTLPDPTWLQPPDLERTGEPPIWVPTDREIAEAVQALVLTEPAVITYACTSGSFCGPPDNEARIREVMGRAGATTPQTTSGALLDALHALGVASIAVGTPYHANVTEALGAFLERAGYAVASLVRGDPAPWEADAHLTEDQVVDLAVRADRADADAIFLSCTALEIYDVIPALEERLSKPVLTATQVTMWAALGAAGVAATGAEQTLVRHRWRPAPPP